MRKHNPVDPGIHPIVSFLSGPLVIMAALAIELSGCGRQPVQVPPTPMPPPSRPQNAPEAEANPIALSDAEAFQTSKNGHLVVYQVKYRFSKGQPNAASWYSCEIKLNHGPVGI